MILLRYKCNVIPVNSAILPCVLQAAVSAASPRLCSEARIRFAALGSLQSDFSDGFKSVSISDKTSHTICILKWLLQHIMTRIIWANHSLVLLVCPHSPQEVKVDDVGLGVGQHLDTRLRVREPRPGVPGVDVPPVHCVHTLLYTFSCVHSLLYTCVHTLLWPRLHSRGGAENLPELVWFLLRLRWQCFAPGLGEKGGVHPWK